MDPALGLAAGLHSGPHLLITPAPARTPMMRLMTLAEGAVGSAQSARPQNEAQLDLPDLHQVKFLGMTGWTLLLIGIGVCGIGFLFGVAKYTKLKNLPVHKAMREISELIYGTCKTYLKTQAKFIFQLWILIAAVIVVYFAALEKVPPLK